jgi:hypothetical protein
MLPYSPIGENLGFTTLPALYWPLLALTLVSYVALTRVVKAYIHPNIHVRFGVFSQSSRKPLNTTITVLPS